jgi:hypothetical protein
MIRELLALLPHRTIYRNGEKYLTRYYLLGGKRRGWRKLLPFNLYIHCFHASDEQPAHNHPWSWSRSLILRGSYREARVIGQLQGGGEVVLHHTYGVGQVNCINADTWHYVTLQTPEVWTLFFAGPRVQCWGFIDGRPG